MTTYEGILPSGSALQVNDDVVSPDGRYQLILQSDGNLVLYDGSHKALWASNTNNQAVSQCIMQTDGNLVIYGFPGPLWSSKTAGNTESYLRVQDDGNTVIYHPSPTWATNTRQG